MQWEYPAALSPVLRTTATNGHLGSVRVPQVWIGPRRSASIRVPSPSSTPCLPELTVLLHEAGSLVPVDLGGGRQHSDASLGLISLRCQGETISGAGRYSRF